MPLKKQYNLDVRHARMVQEMAKHHAKDRGATVDSQLTMSRIIELVYRVWKHTPSILDEETTQASANQHAVVLYEER